MNTNEIITWELTNGCTCTAVADDGNEILDSIGNPVETDFCFGCFQDELELIKFEILQVWADRNGLDLEDEISIRCNAVNWDRVSGEIETPLKDAINALGINTEWRLVFTLDGKELHAVRYSHDEPYGTGKLVFIAPEYSECCHAPIFHELQDDTDLLSGIPKCEICGQTQTEVTK